MVNALDLVRNAVGAPAGPDLVRGVEALPLRELDELAEALLQLSGDHRAISTKPAFELWPLVPWEASVFFEHLNFHPGPGGTDAGFASGGINLTAASDTTQRGSGVFSDGVVRALLYCHGVVISDPIYHAADIYVGAPAEIRRFSRESIATAVASVSEVSELVDAGIVTTFYPGDGAYGPALKLVSAMRERVAGPGSPYPTDAARRDIESELLGDVDHRTPEAAAYLKALTDSDLVDQAITGAAFTLATIELYGGGLDVLSASQVMGRLLFLGAPDPIDQLRVSEVAKTTVPDLGALSMRDLVAIRSSSDALARWRRDLAQALDYGHRLRERGVDPREIERGVAEIVTEGRAAVHREAGETKALSPRGVLGFVAGALAGAGGGVAGGDVGGIVGGVGAGLFASLLVALGSRKPVPGFLDRHYVAFRPDRGRADPGAGTGIRASGP